MKKNVTKQDTRGFTLIEIMIVVILVGIIAAFGVPGYGKLIRRSHERNAILGLTAINQANSIYEIRNGEFLPGAGLNLAAINAGLSIDVKALDLTYSYTRNSVTEYDAESDWTGAGVFTVFVDERPITMGVNPCCSSAGLCPNLPDC